MCKTEQKTFTVRYDADKETDFKKHLEKTQNFFNENTGNKAIIKAVEFISKDLSNFIEKLQQLESKSIKESRDSANYLTSKALQHEQMLFNELGLDSD